MGFDCCLLLYIDQCLCCWLSERRRTNKRCPKHSEYTNWLDVVSLFIYLFIFEKFIRRRRYCNLCTHFLQRKICFFFSLPSDSIRAGSENVNVIPTQMWKEYGINIEHYENAKDKRQKLKPNVNVYEWEKLLLESVQDKMCVCRWQHWTYPERKPRPDVYFSRFEMKK